MEDDVGEILDQAIMVASVFGGEQERRRVMALSISHLIHAILEEDGDDDQDGGASESRPQDISTVPEYSTSTWAVMLGDDNLADETSRAAKLFKRRFRVTYAGFLDLLERVKDEGWLKAADVAIAGAQCIPIELKV